MDAKLTIGNGRFDSTATDETTVRAERSARNATKNLPPKGSRKRVFIALMFLTLTVVAVLLYGAWHIGYLGLLNIHEFLPTAVGAVFAAAVVFAAAALINVTLAVKNFPSLGFLEKETYSLINLFFPLAVHLGKLFGISRRQLEGSFVAVSNVLFARRGIKVPADRLLVITPHCLQLASCPHKITRDPANCKRCGGCNIGDLMKLSDEMGFKFLVATGGTLARQMVKEARPKAVLAIACERDLMSGIKDVYPLPAVGVLNIRPNGPCFNTRVDMEEIRARLNEIVEPVENHDETSGRDDG